MSKFCILFLADKRITYSTCSYSILSPKLTLSIIYVSSFSSDISLLDGLELVYSPK
jgi:hypothetical protein